MNAQTAEEFLMEIQKKGRKRGSYYT
jgi:hypothetical protein